MLASIVYETLLGGWLDAGLILVFTAWREAALLRYAAHSVGLSLHDSWNYELLADQLTVKSLAAGLFAVLFFGLWAHRTPAKQPKWMGMGKPLLIPAKTTHRRTFPEKHGFSYSYLVVGVPVGWSGSAGGMVSSGSESDAHHGSIVSWLAAKTFGSKAWFHVDGADHLGREPGNLESKLHNYLGSQGVDPGKYPHAYLVTAASFMGYNFNPVSFWYLYSADKTLSAMVLEVNNTFGERRMYLLTMDDEPSDGSERKTSRFTKSWPKDFHVSPFNSRKGAYSLQAHDMLSSIDGSNPGRLDGTITLKSSKDHPKIVARLFQEGEPIDPTTASLATKLRFLLGWWWVGFVTFPRIVKEAGRLFFRRKLHVWFRPEPLKETMGRVADSTERQLEPIFRDYLRHLVQQSDAGLTVTYTSSSGAAPLVIRAAAPSQALSKHATQQAGGSDDGDDDGLHLEFRVLTPAFYTRFVHYAHDFEAVFSEFRESQTIWVSRPELVPRLFVSKRAAPPLSISSPRDFLYFSAIRALRRRPDRIERPLTSSAAGPAPATETAQTRRSDDIRQFRISGLDGFVLAHGEKSARRVYRTLVLRVFLAERCALGLMELLWMQELVLRVGLAWVVSKSASGYLRQMESAA
ncbi:hypothetical protein ACHAQA_001791 [Verticillium albo-atrum]